MIHIVTKRRKRKNGKLLESRNYYLRYRIGDMLCDKWVSLGVTDKGVAQSKAVQFIKDLEREIAGIAPPKKLVAAASFSFANLLAEYVDELATRGRDSKYVKGTETRIALVAAECRWKKLCDVSADSFMFWRRGQSLKAKTLNDYLCDVSSFLGWLVKMERLASNPLAKVERVKPKEGEEEEERRAFTHEEFNRLCAVSGPRTLIYQLTLFTGMRRDEVKQLLWGDVRKETNGDTFLKLRASTTKNGKIALQPVPAWLAELLEKHRPSGVKLSRKVFATIPRMPRFYRDLEAAGISRVDDRGHVAVFHSLRHTFGTWLWETGTDPRTIQELMRHGDLRLTSQRYTDTAGLAMNDAVRRLPSFVSPEGGCTQIGAQIFAKTGQNVSQADKRKPEKSKLQTIANECVSRALTGVVAMGQMVRAAGFEPATPSV
jgi:integrase